MQITCISDTHNLHDKLIIPEQGDIIVHAGDITEGGTQRELRDFFKWFAQLPFTHKICIAGNHDFFLENISEKAIKKLIPANVTYLNDSGISINGYKFWGSPYIPFQQNWAFTKSPIEIEEHWKKIPEDTDILITHTPPKGILDITTYEVEVGCPALKKEISKKKPTIHIFGHLHDNYGKVMRKDITYINATSFYNHLKLTNLPIQVEIPD